jgi:hypothetical protein
VAYILVGATGTDPSSIDNTGGVMLYDGNTSGTVPATDGDSGGQPYYAVENVWRHNNDTSGLNGTTVSDGVKAPRGDHLLYRFEGTRVVTSGNNIHVSYYDNVSKSLKYWFNVSGTNWNNAEYRDNNTTRGTPALLARHWVNLDGGFNFYDEGYTDRATWPANTPTGTKRTYPQVRDRDNRYSLGMYTNAGILANTTAWQFDPSRDAGQFNDIAVRSGGQPVIAYYEKKNDQLYVISASSATPYQAANWGAPVMVASHAGQYVSVKVDGSDNLHIVWLDSLNSHLMYTRGILSGNNYTFPYPPVEVDRSGTVGKWADVAVDVNGVPWITYQNMEAADAVNGDVNAAKVAYLTNNTGTNWTIPANWEAMYAGLRYPAKDDRLSIEYRPSTATQFWKAAVGYHSDYFRVGYYVGN